MNIDETIAAIGRLRTDAEKLHAGLHERSLADGHQNDAGLAELYGMLHRFRLILHELKGVLAEQAPAAAR